MGTARAPSLKRLTTILKRQANPGWGSDYKPAIQAVRGEAPNVSHALTLNANKVPGREIHLLSLQESFAALLGLYHPNVAGLQEQRALMPGWRPHPLHNFPGVIAGELSPLRGLIDVAQRLDYVDILPRVWAPDAGREGGRRELVFPYVGDLLWAIRSKRGSYYCVNWSVKDSEIAFKRPLTTERLTRAQEQHQTSVLARHEMECTYYADAGIRTVLLAADGIDEDVRSNLRHLFLHHGRIVELPDDEQAELLSRFQHCLETGVPPSELIVRLTGAGKYSVEDCKNVLFQGIWFRKLRVDLFRPILIDRPLEPETQDVLVRYANWFSESP
ncbi:hypothetical protein LMG27952_06099 [Paraburkholderia hiiakae]|uniref:TnsA endonuclease-like protein n=1 Tax=Paraburkholderia hiiakae TaxID=1081782 RepID=A0ABM8P4S9_9BURK|nr:hypothetical protein [Paraburkholderia hiiakae]CAD6556359.1 hypothetical protein LMG27952_06099 [Paraburkholderia hiiakae]